jgi:ABC-2 type transport system ATP-binding protein
MSAPATIEVGGLTRRFGSVTALADVDLRVEAGTVTGLLGPNGAGKTTLVRILTTLLDAEAGWARVAGYDVARQRQALRSAIGLAGQSAAVDERLTARENLDLVGRLYGLERAERRRRVGEILDRFDLGEAADRRTGTFSGGMRRRLDLGVTLVGRPAVLFLDEPTAGLDPRSRADLWRHLDELVAEGTTVLLTSQYLEEIDHLADQVAVLDHGRVITRGTPAELKRRIGDEVLSVTLADGQGDGERLAATFANAFDGPVHLDADERRLVVPVPRSAGALVTVGRGLEDAGVAIAELAIHRPSLDDVFLALTGTVTDVSWDDASEPATPRPDDHAGVGVGVGVGDPPAGGRAPGRFAGDIAATAGREVRRVLRSPQLLLFMSLQPVLFVLGFAAVFGGAMALAATGSADSPYIDFLLPGSLIMTGVLSGTAIAQGVSLDGQSGFRDRLRSLPVARSAPLIGRSLADLGRSAVGIAAMLAAAAAIGFRVSSGGGFAAAIGLALAFDVAVGWVFTMVGASVKDPEAANAASFMPAVLLVFASSAFVPLETMPDWLQAVARYQPVTVAVDAVRTAMAGQPPGQSWWLAWAWIVGLVAVFAPLSVRRWNRTT